MPVTIKLNGTSLTLVHKFSNGISTATVPDVCKTPTPGGPAPMPYPNIAHSITLSDGTTTVKGDKAMAANKGSKFALSNGDQAGTLGGVKSNVFMKEAAWILYSFDVKLDGNNACRLTDPMYHNAENTVNASGELQQPLAVKALVEAGCTEAEAKAICDSVCESQAAYNRKEIYGEGSISEELERRINVLKNNGTSSSPPTLGSGIDAEVGFYMMTPSPWRFNLDNLGLLVDTAMGALLTTQGAIPIIPDPDTIMNMTSMRFRDAVNRLLAPLKYPRESLVSFPDLVVERNGRRTVFDAKFTWDTGADKLGDRQLRNYRRISIPKGKTPVVLSPDSCNCLKE